MHDSFIPNDDFSNTDYQQLSNYYLNFLIFISLWGICDGNDNAIKNAMDDAHIKTMTNLKDQQLKSIANEVYSQALPGFLAQQTTFSKIMEYSFIKKTVSGTTKSAYIRLVGLRALECKLSNKVLVKEELLKNHIELVMKRAAPDARVMADKIMKEFVYI